MTGMRARTRAVRRAAGVVLGVVLAMGAAPAVGQDTAGVAAASRSGGPAAAAAETGGLSEAEALAEAERTGEPVEISALRSESREVFATPEGELEAREYLRPVWARTGGGWQRVDTDLVATRDGTVAPKASTVGLEFSGGGRAPLVRMERAGRVLSLSWPTALPEPQVQGAVATYPSVLPGVDLRMTAQEDGFSQLLVVKTAQAAASTDLAELRMKMSGEGLDVQETDEGGLKARDVGAQGAVFEAPRPMMWDSSPGGTPTRTASAGRAAASDEGAEPGAAESGKLAAVGVEVPTGQDELVLTPDADVLKGEDTTYPVYIDPQWYSPRASAWTMASKYWASSPQWKFNGDADAGLGYCNWSYCNPNDTKRLFYRIPVSTFAGKSILSAEFVVRNTWSASCSARSVELWQTKDISSSTTWNSQDASGFWVKQLDSASFAYGYSGCAAKDAEFDVKSAVQAAANSKSSTMTFGLQAASESDAYGWKRFSDKAYLRVKYNRPPSQIKLSQLTMSPGGSCVPADKMVRIRSTATVRANDVTDPDGDAVSVQFQASWDAGDGAGWKARWTSARTTSKASGSDFSIVLPSSIPKNKHVDWHVRSYDGAQWSSWSYSGAHGCHFIYDTSVPVGPVITSAQYGASDSEDPDDPWWDGVGRYGTFSVETTSTDVTKYWFGINTSPSSANTLTTTGGGVKTIKFMPTRPGVNFITAQAFDAAGNGSEPTTYTFRVRAGQPDRVTWQMDENSGAAKVAGAGGDWPAVLHGATPGGPGVAGSGLTLDGTDDYAATVSPVLNTGKSFTVSLWAKLPGTDPGRPSVALSQPGQNHSGFEIYYSSALGGWVFLRHADDASSGGTAARAVQPACAAGDTPCVTSRLSEWTNLVGVFDNPNQQIRLYVGGKLVGSAAYSRPWDARGGTILGAAKHYGALADYFPGSLDDVELFDYQLTDTQVAKLAARSPVDTGRPAKLVWPLDEAANATAVVGRGQAADAVLKGGAATGTAGVSGRAVSFDGVDDHATTGRPLLDTFQSFTVSAWVQLPKDKEARAMTAVSQLGTVRRSFELYHSSALGGWVFSRPESDVSGASIVRATHTACAANTNCAAGRFGEWNHVVGVYDADAGKLLLYVNGTLQASTPFTSRWSSEGPVSIGSGLNPDGAVASPLKGSTDDVRLYDRVVSGDEVQQLFKQRPLVKSRWTFEETANATPVTVPDAAGTGNVLTMNGGASKSDNGFIDFGAMELDGTSGYASASSMPVDTSGSFTMTAWAQAAAIPAGTVALTSAEGSKQSAFTVRFVPDAADPENSPGRWQLTVADKDATDAEVVQADNAGFSDAREWNHLALVYDGFAKEARLYVNGGLSGVTCPDTDGDGVSDSDTCADQVPWAENALSFKATSLQIGRSGTGSSAGSYFPGLVDDVWTFQGALNDSQIAELAGSFFDIPTEVPAGS
ncbi:LamG-like jellyroll fold domain-containing protein [Streptomyces shenzhenensis]|uniref:LamG-like jellyroll fold domain-containing protein n=1 Tax=Streptomyces shenzhenensis TaxID=943815 RepID=UPI003F542190